MSDRDVARDIRRDVEAAGGSRWVPMRTLRDAFGRTALTRKARGEIAEALAGVGVLADPPLDAVELKDDVRLFLLEAAPPPRRDPAPAPVWAPRPRQPGLWERFRAWPAWARWAAGIAAVVLLIAVLAGDDASDDGGSPQPAQQASGGDEEDAEERERARERKRARARRKRERARERDRVRERRRERRREEARERRRREREAERPPPAVEPPEDEPADGGGDGCDPNYSGCVPEYPPDVNCPEVDGPVEVVGRDPHGLDRDNDGVGCE